MPAVAHADLRVTLHTAYKVHFSGRFAPVYPPSQPTATPEDNMPCSELTRVWHDLKSGTNPALLS
ncbi:hypothetical protein PCANC_00805 [Puccinia coronata f. sp. avenae]|uniref:Uncharacterized protein n=1 Tax=Puccinia coronata f. sp. avenae TaxID=200324 RepID=A0A2N5W7S7_9BASI|nr:hypothetical protein PCANC_00805 [Puccinia coronata f. sp. avenae]